MYVPGLSLIHDTFVTDNIERHVSERPRQCGESRESLHTRYRTEKDFVIVSRSRVPQYELVIEPQPLVPSLSPLLGLVRDVDGRGWWLRGETLFALSGRV